MLLEAVINTTYCPFFASIGLYLNLKQRSGGFCHKKMPPAGTEARTYNLLASSTAIIYKSIWMRSRISVFTVLPLMMRTSTTMNKKKMMMMMMTTMLFMMMFSVDGTIKVRSKVRSSIMTFARRRLINTGHFTTKMSVWLHKILTSKGRRLLNKGDG